MLSDRLGEAALQARLAKSADFNGLWMGPEAACIGCGVDLPTLISAFARTEDVAGQRLII
jgi:hypothetical protein